MAQTHAHARLHILKKGKTNAEILSVQDKGEQERLCAALQYRVFAGSACYAGYDDDDNFACIAQFTY